MSVLALIISKDSQRNIQIDQIIIIFLPAFAYLIVCTTSDTPPTRTIITGLVLSCKAFQIFLACEKSGSAGRITRALGLSDLKNCCWGVNVACCACIFFVVCNCEFSGGRSLFVSARLSRTFPQRRFCSVLKTLIISMNYVLSERFRIHFVRQLLVYLSITSL